MNEQNWNSQDTWQTGSTRPKKRKRGIVALIFGFLIFAGGVACALKLVGPYFLKEDTAPDNHDLSFYQETTDDQPDNQPEDPVTGSDSWSLTISGSPQSVENVPQEGGLSLQAIYEKAIPSVVSISCALDRGTSSGTGVVMSRDGYIVTNCHVIEDAREIQVLFTDGRTLPAKIVGDDPVSDLAVLSVDATDLQPAEFGDSTALRVGDTVAAIGDPLGIELRGTLTNGIISAINRDVATAGRTMTLIQTNAALNSGNSGGPLLNCYGQVIGINTLKIGDYMSDAGVEGLGFAIPSSTVKEVAEQLLAKGYVSGRPSLGITVETVPVFQQIYAQLPKGVYITAVDPDSDAAEKGLLPGDILLSVNGVRISSAEEITSLQYTCQPGAVLKIIFYRSGRQYQVDLTVGEIG